MPSRPASSPFWAPHVHADRRPLLLARGRIVAALRAWFAASDFIEVETGALQVSPGNETHLHAFATTLAAPDGAASRLYLRTSPEFACKKLLAAGERRIVEFAKVFRNRERGALHHPEFTLVEWYRAGEPYETLMADCAAILARRGGGRRDRQLSFRGRSADPFAEPERLTVAEAFARFAGIDLLATLPGGEPDRDGLPARRAAAGIRIGDDDPLGRYFQPRAGGEDRGPISASAARPFSIEYPAVQAALARPAPDRRVAERFELYACGVELANGFGELTDAAEQRRRLRTGDGGEGAHLRRALSDRRGFLAALAAMPQACGIALGLDRLVMLATGASRIEQVLWNPLRMKSASTTLRTLDELCRARAGAARAAR